MWGTEEQEARRHYRWQGEPEGSSLRGAGGEGGRRRRVDLDREVSAARRVVVVRGGQPPEIGGGRNSLCCATRRCSTNEMGFGPGFKKTRQKPRKKYFLPYLNVT